MPFLAKKNPKVTERGEGATDQSCLFKINYGFSSNPSWLVTFSLVYRWSSLQTFGLPRPIKCKKEKRKIGDYNMAE